MNQSSNIEKEPTMNITIQMLYKKDLVLTKQGVIDIKLSFKTEREQMIFEQLLSLLSNVEISVPSNAAPTAEYISLTPNSLKDIISRWHPTREGLKKEQMVADIISKVRKQENTVTYYECRHSKYKLEISNEGSYFYDLMKNKAYCFAK